MKRLFRCLLETATLLGALCLQGAHAVTVIVDFNDPELVFTYFPGESFTQSGMLMTQGFDFGTVDGAAALGNVAPSGNETQFYFNSNDGALFMQQEQGLPFSLNGFSAAFVPQSPASTQTTVIAAIGYDASQNVAAAAAWLFAPQASNGRYAFGVYDDPSDFTDFADLQTLVFFSCSLSGGNVCADLTNNNGQFALDDIQITVVPEPSSVALIVLGLGLLAPILRRRSC